MRSSAIILVLVILSCFLIRQTNQFSFPKLDLTQLQKNLKSAGQKIIDKFAFVRWIVDRIKSLTNTKKDVTNMITDAVDKYWQRKKFVNLNVEDIDEQQPQFTKHLQAQIDNFQDYLIRIYQIDTKDSDFIRHIKSDPDRFFLNYDAYQLLKGMNTDASNYKKHEVKNPHHSISDYDL